jgi:hypothetical protein
MFAECLTNMLFVGLVFFLIFFLAGFMMGGIWRDNVHERDPEIAKKALAKAEAYVEYQRKLAALK